MYLVKLHLESAPGLKTSIRLDELEPGLVLLVGPNGSGKSTIGRTIRGSLWPDFVPSGVFARSWWQVESRESFGLLEGRLSHGQYYLDDDLEPPGAELGAAWQLSLSELLSTGATSDAKIAERIQKELDGGYSLKELSAGGKHKKRPSHTESAPYREASQDLTTYLNQANALRDQEERLRKLEEEARDALSVPARLVELKSARRRLEVLRVLSLLEEQLQEYPENLEHLPERAATRAKALIEKVDKRAKAAEERRNKREKCSESVAGFVFPNGDPGELVVLDWLEKADNLVDGERDLVSRRAEYLRQQERLQVVSSQVWSGKGLETIPEQRVLETISTSVNALSDAKRSLGALPEGTFTGPKPLSDREREDLVDAASLLRQWQDIPPLPVGQPEQSARTSWVLVLGAVGLFLSAVGLLLAILVSPWLGLVLMALGVGALCFGGGLWLGPRVSVDGEPLEDSGALTIERRYLEKGFSPPTEWRFVAVGLLLDSLSEQSRLNEKAADAHKSAQRQQAAREQQLGTIDSLTTALSEACKELGLADEFSGLTLSIQADRVVELAKVNVDFKLSAAGLEEQESAQAKGLKVLREAVEALELSSLPLLDNVNALSSVVQSVEKRRSQWQAAVAALEKADEDLVEIQALVVEANGERDKHLALCGVAADELDTLVELGEKRVDWLEVLQSQRDLKGELKKLEADLSGEEPETIEAIGVEEERLTQRQSSLDGIKDEVANIKLSISEATNGRTIQQTLARQAAGLDTLVVSRDAQLKYRVSAALVGWLQADRRRTDAPKLLERARDWFARFTAGRYELSVGINGHFVAIDHHTQSHQSMGELSDGTRIQALLAARLSFIEEIEQDGAKTPLFLDEVLSTTDPVRFAAISSAVFELVKDGRQVFYATADRTEAQAWMEAAETQQVAQPQVKVLDGGLPESEWDEPPPLPNAVPEVPPPGESDAIEYMALLKLRRPRRYESVGAWPLGLVLYDDLDLVHQIFAAGLRTVSQLDYEQKGIPMPLTAAQLAVVRGRVTIIEAALEALQVGYNIPITWEAVEASKAITPGKREKTLASLELHSLDSKKFIEGCGLQKHKLPVLIEHLEPLGMVDLREALSEEEVRKRALLAGKKQLEDGLISLADVAALVELVQGVVVTP